MNGKKASMPAEEADATMIIPECQSSDTALIGDTFRPLKKKRQGNLKTWTRGLFYKKRETAEESLNPSDRPSAPSDRVDLSLEMLSDVSSRYFIADSPFASGGQGRISVAVDKTLGCEVAVKSLHENFCTDLPEREAFLKEARLTASLDHPGIVPIHGLYCDADRGMHLAMKLIEGYTLKEYLAHVVEKYDQEGIYKFSERKSLRNRIEIMLRVCDALACAHGKGIIHRDLKPENIMIGKHHETYVTDWGIASRLGEASPEKLKGTPRYIAPELLEGKGPDVRSDVYSLAIILFELVTLMPAFGECDLTELVLRVKNGQRAPIKHRYGCRIDKGLKAVILKGASPDPEKRYQSVEDFASDLRRYLANEELQARPDNLFSKTARWGINHFKSVLVFVLFFLLLGAGGITWTLHKQISGSIEKRNRDHAAGTAYSMTVSTANEIEKGVKKIEYLLEVLRMNLQFSSLNIKTAFNKDSSFFVDIAAYRTKPPREYRYAPVYRGKVDFDHACVFNYLGRKIDFKNLIFFHNSAKYMQRIMFDIPGKTRDEAEIKQWLANEGKAGKMVYFALHNGLFCVFPGMADFPKKYDPRPREWFQAALKAQGHAVWSRPYRDVGRRRELTLTCSLAVMGEHNKSLGVAAADFSLNRMASQMLKAGGELARYTREKLLIDHEGEIIFRMTPTERRDQSPFSEQKLIQKMVRRKHGTLTAFIGDKEVLVSFAYVPTLRILYAECLDMEELLLYIRPRVTP